ncbi:MAG: UvrD-helicase domain-containing protein [Synechococcus sp.]
MALKHDIRLAISDDFLDSFSQLPRNAQSKVSEFINRFKQDPTRPGLNYESIRNGRDKRLKSVRVDQAHRAIVLKPDEGNVYILLWVDKHDEAYDWAKRKLCQVNRVSGALQIIDVEEADRATEELTQNRDRTQTTIFDSIKDKYLLRLGVPEILMPAIRQLVTEEDLDRLIPHLPSEASDALTMLAAGYELDTVLNWLEKQKEEPEADPEDLVSALDNDDSRSRFIVITDDGELEEMLAAPLEKWRVFLHPSQRKLVARDWNGPVRVLGGAGTGKTVVAMHRARWLAEQRFNQSGDRTLFTTFTRNLATDIEANLQTICSPETMRRIQVLNLDAWVAEFLRREDIDTTIVYEQKTDNLWEEAYELAPMEFGLSIDFYKEEWQQVVLASGCQNLREYLTARRTGRGTRLSRKQRQAIWPVFEEYRGLLRERGWKEPDEAMRDAAKLITSKGEAFLPFNSVIVDEAQDMSAPAFQLIRAIAGSESKNDLFIVGDPHQRIYGKVVTLSQCGVNIRGRGRKLRLNYRTTDETRKWATAILKGVTADDLDGGRDGLSDYRSLMHGEEPILKGFTSFEEELTFLKSVLTQLSSNNAQQLSGVCLALRTHLLLEKYEAALKTAGFDVKQIHRDRADNPLDGGIRLGTMHRIKGLQFDYVFLPGLNNSVLPLQKGLEHCPDEASRDKFIDGERCLLHVAATRAKKQVIASYYDVPSKLLGET